MPASVGAGRPVNEWSINRRLIDPNPRRRRCVPGAHASFFSFLFWVFSILFFFFIQFLNICPVHYFVLHYFCLFFRKFSHTRICIHNIYFSILYSSPTSETQKKEKKKKYVTWLSVVVELFRLFNYHYYLLTGTSSNLCSLHRHRTFLHYYRDHHYQHYYHHRR